MFFFSEETEVFLLKKFNNYQWFEAAVNRNVVICFAVSFCISPGSGTVPPENPKQRLEKMTG